jgi:hypothetical protein
MSFDGYQAELRYLQEFVVQQTKKSGQFIVPENLYEYAIKVNSRYDPEFHHYIVEMVKFFYTTTDSNRFKTTTTSKTETTEVDVDMIPVTIWDHIKHNIVKFITHKLRLKSKIKVNYVVIKHTTTNITNTTNHVTTIEYSCPHLNLPGNHRSHIVHLALGVPDLKQWLDTYKS